MWTAVGKFIGSKVVTAVLVVSVAGGVIWFWKHPEDLRDIWETIKVALAWLGFAAVLPWALFFMVPVARKLDSNAASAGILLFYFTLDALAALWLAGWHLDGALSWTIMLLGLLTAAAYNFLVAETVDNHIN